MLSVGLGELVILSIICGFTVVVPTAVLVLVMVRGRRRKPR